MHPKVVFLVLVLVLAIWQPHLSLGNAEDTTTEVSLYAHTDPSATSVNGRVLTLLGNTTSRQAADVRNGLDFTLVPPLSAPLRVIGRIDAIVWLQAQQSVRGTLQVTISELTANASAIEITSGSVTVPVSSLPYQVQFGLGRVNYTLPAGSSIRFEIQFLPGRDCPGDAAVGQPIYFHQIGLARRIRPEHSSQNCRPIREDFNYFPMERYDPRSALC